MKILEKALAWKAQAAAMAVGDQSAAADGVGPIMTANDADDDGGDSNSGTKKRKMD